MIIKIWRYSNGLRVSQNKRQVLITHPPLTLMWTAIRCHPSHRHTGSVENLCSSVAFQVILFCIANASAYETSVLLAHQERNIKETFMNMKYLVNYCFCGKNLRECVNGSQNSGIAGAGETNDYLVCFRKFRNYS